jgi:hypothetical protein
MLNSMAQEMSDAWNTTVDEYNEGYKEKLKFWTTKRLQWQWQVFEKGRMHRTSILWPEGTTEAMVMTETRESAMNSYPDWPQADTVFSTVGPRCVGKAFNRELNIPH